MKKSFTILEVVLSLTLLAFIFVGFNNSFITSNLDDKTFMLLNSLENSFDTKDYTNFTRQNKTLKITLNNTNIKYISVKQYSFHNQNIKLLKYEK